MLTLLVAGDAGATAIPVVKPDYWGIESIAHPAKPAAVPRPPPRAASASAGDVLRAQVLLDRAHFSSGEINGSYGGTLRQAIRGFQKLHQLPVSGTLDAATRSALAVDQAPALVAYTVSAQDAAGPYVAIPATMAAKSKLAALGYTNVAEALGEKFHCSPALLKRLNPGKVLGRAGEQLTVPNVAAGAPLPKASKILVDKTDGTLTLLDASGTPFAQYPASTGSAHDPLPLGQWQVRGIAHHPTYRYQPKLFWDARRSDTKATLAAGPNNPVGMVWIELSKEHYGIHGTPEPANIAKTQSHGCIRLTNWDALAVANAIARGALVLMQ
ncbi:lipoprotein-anchoring transpeptidase ErfK/SrfK [Oxalobacteraceae bacterium GrIS 1.11]